MLASLALIPWDMAWPYLLATVFGGYLLGSIPFGLLFARLAGAGDIRRIGSGNIGATNVLRTGKRWAAAATLLCDALKGFLAAMLAGFIFGNQTFVATAAIGAFLGHLFPVWLGFKGGKGVATFIGITFAFAWPVACLTCATWLVAARTFRFSSLAALIAAAMAPVYFLLPPFRLTLWALIAGIMAVLIAFAHRTNIGRLLRGEEPRIGRA